MSHLYETATLAMQIESARLRTISQNLANAGSAGYKRETDGAAFAQLLAATPAAGTDFAQGTLRSTGDPAHLALDGPGFFELRRGDSVRYSRAGAFVRDVQGHLVDGAGYRLQAQGGDLVLRAPGWRIERDGTVIEDEQPVARLRVVDFESTASLRRAGAASFAGEGARPAREPSVRQGALENANVAGADEMVRLMETMRRFEFAQRVVQTQDELIDKAMRRLSEN